MHRLLSKPPLDLPPHPTLDAVHASIAQLHWYKWQGIELDKNIVKLWK